MLTINQIFAATGCNLPTLTAHYPGLLAACELRSINTPKRLSAFLANVIYETDGLSSLIERLSYSNPLRIVQVFRKFDLDKDRIVDPEEIEFAKLFVRNPIKLANYVYDNRFGNSKPGDGWRFRGRGMFCTTFYDNYLAVSSDLGYDFIADPDALALPPYAARSAAFFWFQHDLNTLADKGDFYRITKTISGSGATHAERMLIFNKLIKCF